MTLKVFRWQDHRPSGVGQTFELVAAHSKAEVGRIVGARPAQLFNLTETANPQDRETALARPGVVHYKPTADRRAPWTADERSDTPPDRAASPRV